MQLGHPPIVVEGFIRKVVRETAEFENVLYQDGNESFKVFWHGGSREWHLGIAKIVRDELSLMGLSRPIGTNSHDPVVGETVLRAVLNGTRPTHFWVADPSMPKPSEWAYEQSPTYQHPTTYAFDYVSIHNDGRAVQVHYNKPTQVNEYPNLTPEYYEVELYRAAQLGTMFHYWRGGNNDTQFLDTLARIKRFREGLP